MLDLFHCIQNSKIRKATRHGLKGYENYVRFGLPSRTTDREIKIALRIARDCPAQLRHVDIASILLSLKHRKYSSLIVPGECLFRSTIIRCMCLSSLINSAQSHLQRPEWANKPEEVHRYWVLQETSWHTVPDSSATTSDHSTRNIPLTIPSVLLLLDLAIFHHHHLYLRTHRQFNKLFFQLLVFWPSLRHLAYSPRFDPFI
jgi:hypothetical protein